MASNSPTLFEDIFEVLARDPDGKKFDKGNVMESAGHAWHASVKGRLSQPAM